MKDLFDMMKIYFFMFLIVIFFSFSVVINEGIIRFIYNFSNLPNTTSYYYAFLDLNFIDEIRIKEFVQKKELFNWSATVFFVIFSWLIYYISLMFYSGVLQSILGPNTILFSKNEKLFTYSPSSFNIFVISIFYFVSFILFPYTYRPIFNFSIFIFLGHLLVDYDQVFKLKSLKSKASINKVIYNIQTVLFISLSLIWFGLYVHFKQKGIEISRYVFYLCHILLYITALVSGFKIIKYFDFNWGFNDLPYSELIQKEDEKLYLLEVAEWEKINAKERSKENKVENDFFKKIKSDTWVLKSKRNNKSIEIEFLSKDQVSVKSESTKYNSVLTISSYSELSIPLNDNSVLDGRLFEDKIVGVHKSKNGKWSFELIKSSDYERSIKKIIEPKATVAELNVSNYQPTSGVTFEIETSLNDYKYFAIYQYYPIRHGYNLPDYDLDNRRHVFNFKDGINPDFYADLFASALFNKFGRLNLKNKYLLIVPASNKNSTERRFKRFSEILCNYTGFTNGYNYLINKNIDRIPSHNGGVRNYNPSDFLEIRGNITGKDLIIIDDVRTSGRSSNNIYSFLKTQNPQSITFCYLGRTV